MNGVKARRGGNRDGGGIIFAGSMAYIMAAFKGAWETSRPEKVPLAFFLNGK